jgi:hypothetical protein
MIVSRHEAREDVNLATRTACEAKSWPVFLVSSTKRLTPKKQTYLARIALFWKFAGSNGPITSSGIWWDSVSRQLEHYFTGLQGFSEGVIYTSFYTSRSYGSINLQPAHNDYITYKHHNQPSVDFTWDVISSLLVNLKCLDENG